MKDYKIIISSFLICISFFLGYSYGKQEQQSVNSVVIPSETKPGNQNS